jgi:hypothetical protein
MMVLLAEWIGALSTLMAFGVGVAAMAVASARIGRR